VLELFAGGAVGQFPGDVEVAGMAGVFLQDVDEDPRERRPEARVILGESAARRGEAGQVGLRPRLPGSVHQRRAAGNQLRGGLVRADTPASGLAGQSVASAALLRPGDLAALHREPAANIPFGGTHPGRAGTAADRNVELLISPPFPLARLPGA
jgi:hypothetical protein